MTVVATRPARPLPAPTATRGTVLCLVAAVGFGVGPLFAKAAYAGGASVPTVLSARFAIAAALLWVLVAWRRPALPSRSALLGLAALGALGYAAQAGFYYGSLTRIDASLAALVVSVHPALVVVLAMVVLRRRPSRRQLAALACIGCGLLLLLGTGSLGGSVDALGVVLVCGAAVIYAGYLTIVGSLPVRLDLTLLSAIVCTSAAASLATAGAATGTLSAPASLSGWGWIVLLAVVSTVIPVGSLLAGVRSLGPPTAAIVSSLEPAVTVVSTVVVYGERLTLAQLAGGLVVLASVVVLHLRRRS